jgi:hypothetical protein
VRVGDDRVTDRPFFRVRDQQNRQCGQATEDMVVNNGGFEQAECDVRMKVKMG